MISRKTIIVGFAFVVLLIIVLAVFSNKPNTAEVFTPTTTLAVTTLYKSVTLNIPNTPQGANFRQLQFFAGTTDVTSLATMSQVDVNGQDTPFNGSNIFVDGGTVATLTATFATPQAITSVVYTPHPSFLCRSWGMTFTTITNANVSQTSPVLQPSQCTAYSADPVDRGDASSFHYTYIVATNKW
jgi:hypothetical protein